ncbi:MAG TPA: MurR/RpiR family transcriptional regulator [Albitalea sp.]|nr:MurR/RpiR family transcriptional regulator [Albitalea sp.]
MTDRADSYEELKHAISEAYPRMSPQLQRIARFALDKPHDLALGTVATIAGAAEVQPSSMIRFANALGFSGFSQMQQVFQGHLVERSVSYAQRFDPLRRGRRSGPQHRGVLHSFVGDAVAELARLEDNIRADDMKAAVKLLCGARQIHVLAQRHAFPIACYLAPALNQLELPVRLLDGVGGMLHEFSRGIGSGDVLLAASFRPYSPDVIETAGACRARGAKVIAITDSTLSPLKPLADVCFELGDDSDQPLRSLVGPLCLAQALVAGTGHQLAASPPAASGGKKRKSTRAK